MISRSVSRYGYDQGTASVLDQRRGLPKRLAVKSLNTSGLKRYLTKLFIRALNCPEHMLSTYIDERASGAPCMMAQPTSRRIRDREWLFRSKKSQDDGFVREFSALWGSFTVQVHSNQNDTVVTRIAVSGYSYVDLGQHHICDVA